MNNKSRQIKIYQSESANPTKCSDIRSLVSRYPDETTERKIPYRRVGFDTEAYKDESRPYDGIACHFSINGQLALDLREVCTAKYIDETFICSLSRRQLGILFNAIIDGDGTRTKSGLIYLKQVNNKDLISNMQLIASLLGYKTTTMENECHEKRYPGKIQDIIYMHKKSERYSPDTHYKSLQVDKVDYDDFVWCPSTENGTVVSRRNGNVTISGNSWMYDEYFEKASLIFRTDTIVNAPVVKELFGELPTVEHRKTGKDICVIQFASDDNPTLDRTALNELFANIDDKPTLARRRYGMFAQASGRVLKSYNQAVHFISTDRWFEDGIPVKWIHARGIDYHQRNDWHFLTMSLSPDDEAFIWCEKKLPPDSMTTFEMSRILADITGRDIKFILSMIDPLANIIQGNTGLTTIHDLNRYFSALKRDGVGTGGYWQPWDTRSLRGREQLRLRLKNANRCKVPFNNVVKDEKGIKKLPTIWVLDTCPQTAQYLRMWRHEENKGRDDGATKDEREDVQQKWSHFPMVIEGILKEQSFRPRMNERQIFEREMESHKYFNAMR